MLCVVAVAACGGGGDSTVTAQTGASDAEPSAAAPAEVAPSSDFLSARPGAGIAAAGGDPHAVGGDNPCEQSGPAATEPVVISYVEEPGLIVGANLAELDAVGLEAIITFSPANRNGAERFRVLQADPDCVLNFWGCMRSTTDWLLPAMAG